MDKELKKILAKSIKRGYLMQSEMFPYYNGKKVEIVWTRSKECSTCEKTDYPISDDREITIDKEMKIKILRAITAGSLGDIDLGVFIRSVMRYKACESCPIYLNYDMPG
ncbi:MAG: hypothetical protein WC319_09265 [Candidatus Paceibacterota bacterium]|jgi:hypothetical protein